MERQDTVNQNQNTVIVYDENEEIRLKHLDFVEAIVENMVVFLTRGYELTSKYGAPLSTQVKAFEEFLKTIFGPVCDKFHHGPFQLLEFLDRKVNELIHEVHWKHQPLLEILTQVTRKATEVTRELAMEMKATGLVDATANAAKEAYVQYKPVVKKMLIKYEPVAEEYAVWAWQWCKQVSMLSQATQSMVSAAAFWADRYNQMVEVTAESGLPVAQYLPLIPIERVAYVFAEETNENLCGQIYLRIGWQWFIRGSLCCIS